MNGLNQALVEALGLALLHFLWQGALIGLAFAAISRLARTASARTRYATAVLALVALAVAPALTLGVLLMQPSVPVAEPGAAQDLAPSLLVLTASAEAGSSGHALLRWIVLGWLAGVIIMSLRLLFGWQYLQRLRRSADFAAVRPLAPALDALLARLNIRRPVKLAVSRGIGSPVVIGWLKPLVLLPPAVVAGLPIRQIEMVLAHELAHIRRFDHIVNLFQTIIETVLFYHPVVRWISRRIRIERENACDDLAVAVTEDRLSYVEMLAALERMRYRGTRLALAVHDGQVLGRIRRLVERSGSDRQLGLTVPVALLGLIALLATGVGLLSPPPQQQATSLRPDDRAAVVPTATERPAPPSTVVPEPRERRQTEARSETAATEAPTGSAPVSPRLDPPPRELTPATPQNRPLPEPDPSPSAPSESGPDADLGRSASAVDAASSPVVDPAAVPSREPAASASDQPAPTVPTEPATTQEPATADSATMAWSASEPPATVMEPAEALAMVSLPTLPSAASAAAPSQSRPPLTGGEVIERIEPDYPARARRRSTNGTAEVVFSVTPQGRVEAIELIREQPRGFDFGQAAIEAIGQWQFEPFRRGSEPVSHRVRLTFEFELDDEAGCIDLLGSRIPRC